LHEPIISQELFDEVQSILDGRTPPPTPKRKVNPDFPLKCFVRCDSCGKPLTGGSNKGKTKWYRRYWCYRKDCGDVNILADELEDQFVNLLERLRPAPGDDSSISKKALKRWADRQGDVKKETERLEAALEELKREKRELLKLLMDKRISDTTYQGAEKEYSDSIVSAERDLRSLQSRGGEQEEFLRFVEEFRSVDVAAAWQMAAPESKKRVQTFLFSGGLKYSRKTESLNPSNSSFFSCLEGLLGSKSILASLTTSSLNHFTEIMDKAEALSAEIAIITNDLPATNPAPRFARDAASRQPRHRRKGQGSRSSGVAAMRQNES
jgi:hypothetical protein